MQTLVLPLLSIAALVTVVTPTGKVEPLAGTLPMKVTVPHKSVAVTLNVTLPRLHWPGSAVNTMFAGHVITGGSVSRTLTLCTQVAVFPLLSDAVQVTRLVPTRNCAGASFVTVTAPQLSLVVGLPNATPVAVQLPVSTLTVTSAGHVMVGSCVSLTVTVKVQVLMLPLLSVAMLVTIVTPTGKVLPLDGTLTTLVTLQLSAALTTKVTLLRLQWPGSAVLKKFFLGGGT